MHYKKTEQELLFTKLYSILICSNSVFKHEKEQKVMEFLKNSEFYYDVFCESIYSVMTNDRVKTLSLDEKGHIRLNLFSPLTFDAGIELLSKDDVSNPDDDVIVYVNLALQRLLQKVSHKECLGI